MTGASTLPRLHLVTDDELLAADDWCDLARTLLVAGGRRLALHLRGPRSSGRRIFELATALRPVSVSSGSLLVVNDRVDVARVAEVPAVQLGQRSLPAERVRTLLPSGSRIGVSTHDDAEVEAACTEGADWVFVGTLHPTPSHPEAKGRGVAALRRAVARAGSIPVLGIGGITPEGVAEIREAGGHGVAVVRGIWNASRPPEAMQRYLDTLHEETE